ncbi:MAG: hypothetical protein JJU02_15980 [Cryomorphaceae bacterium]|nr:hypothetical protein [Cryomorphaceae bacterium]
MLIPEKDELADLCFYQYSHRGGRMTENHLRLKSVPMIYEGAILQKPLKGKIASISPEKATQKVFKRNGKGFCIPVSSIFS